MIDPEDLSFAQLFWLILLLMVVVFFLCRFVDMSMAQP